MAATSIATGRAAAESLVRIRRGFGSGASVVSTLVGLLVTLPIVAQAAGMGADDARHLLTRAGFGAAPREIAQYARLTRSEAVERLLAGTLQQARSAPPAWVNEPITPLRELRQLSPDDRRAAQMREMQRGLELRGWWLGEMLTTPSQLTERMTLVWHNHFVSSQQKVRYSQLMYRQNVLLRSHAAGNFGALLHAVAKDPAMVIYLDSATNRKDKPNENFAREVMELFTLGEGRYTEADIREAARAFTGWSIEPQTGEFRRRPAQHDEGVKTVLGRSGNLDGDDVLDILLAQPATAELVVARLWREFIAPEPDAREVARIAARLRADRYEIKTALRELFLSPAFWAPPSRSALIKSPVDYVVGTLRSLDFSVDDPLPLALVVARLGQNLFAPPNVKGWPGGEAWINSTTLLARKQFVERMFRADEMPAIASSEMGRLQGVAGTGAPSRERMARAMQEIRFDPHRWLDQFPGAVTQADMARALLAREPVNALPPEANTRELVRALALDPAYQLK